MERLPFLGVWNATNAFAVTDDARTAYAHDPKADVVIAIDLQNGTRRALKWDDKTFAHRRWVCYSIFTMTKESGREKKTEYVSILFFNQQKKVFCLVHFEVKGELLVKMQTNVFNTSTINKERLAYSVSKDTGEMQIIFYERFSSSTPTSPSSFNPPPRLRFIFFSFDCSTMRVSATNGLLPLNGQWELPFISNNSLHFISSASTPHLFISYPRNADVCWETFVPQPIGIMAVDAYPPRKALWCNAWCRGVGWFSVTQKEESEDGRVSRKTSLWRLDVESEWKWRRHACSLETPEYTKSFALRLTSPAASVSSSYCIGFLHADWKQHAEAAIFKVRLENPVTIRRASILSDSMMKADDSTSSECSETEEKDAEDGLHLRRNNHRGRYNKTPPKEALSDLECPICLDTYEDARTLSCGHSMCWECIEQMRISVKNETIRCPNCRQATTIPPGGLPINYGLKDAICALSRLVVTRKGCLKCMGCREKTEKTKMWLCITCCRNSSNSSSKLKRPTSLFLPTRDESEIIEERRSNNHLRSPGSHSCDATPITDPSTPAMFTSFPGPSSTVVSPHSTAKEPPSQDQRLLQYSFCATCLLNDHAGHEYEGLSKMRDRAAQLAQKREEYGRRAETTINEIRDCAARAIEERICGPLHTMVNNKLDSLADIVIVGEDNEVELRSEMVLSKLDDIRQRLNETATAALHDLLESCNLNREKSPKEKSPGYSTQL